MAFSMAWLAAEVEPDTEGDRVWARDRLADFREELYECFTARPDALFELADAVLCAEGPVKTLVGLSLAPEHRRGHGALYDAVNHGRIEITRLRWSLAVLPLPRWPDGRIRLGVDGSNWLRPDAATSPERMFCHCYGRGKGNAQMIPGWPYSVVAALEPGRTFREVVGRLAAAGRWRPGDEDILVVFDAGYDVTRLAWLLADLPVELCGRLRSDRVLCFPAPPRPDGQRGRPSRHGAELRLAEPATWPEPAATTSTDTTRYGTAVAAAWDRLHPRLARRSAWAHHDGELPVIEGTLIQLTVDHLPGDRDPKPVWLWSSATGADRPPALIPLRWTAYGRRSCAGLTWNTPSACSSRHSAGPSRRSAIPPPPTGGPGWSSPATPSSAPPARRRPAPSLGETGPAGTAHPRPSPPRISLPARDSHLPGRRAETRQTRPRTAPRLEKPPPSAHPQRRQDQHEDLTTALGTQPTISTGP